MNVSTARLLFRFQNDPRPLAHFQAGIRIDEQRLLERHAAPVPPWNFADIATMMGTLITAIVGVLLNVAMGFISLFVAFVIAPTINALIVAAIFFSIVGIAYLCRRLYYYLRPLPAAPRPSETGL
jgi:hypothetical protein